MGWDDLRPWGIKKRYILLALILLVGFCKQESHTTAKVADITKIAAGRLEAEYSGLSGKPFNVAMKSGGYENSRANDIEELAKDWLFFRKRILERAAAGDSKGAQAAREDFQQVNAWLDRYDQRDVTFMIGRFEGR